VTEATTWYACAYAVVAAVVCIGWNADLFRLQSASAKFGAAAFLLVALLLPCFVLSYFHFQLTHELEMTQVLKIRAGAFGAMTTAIWEQTLFACVLYGIARKSIGNLLGAVSVSGLFALAHFELGPFFLLSACILLIHLCDSLTPAVLFHFSWDVAVLSMPYTKGAIGGAPLGIEQMPVGAGEVFLLFVLVGFFITTLLMLIVRYRYDRHPLPAKGPST
jgi:membrane protease YdiL (CAAX protease family)